MADFIAKLKQNFRGDVAEDDATLDKYSRDASIFTVRPRLVVFPKDAADVKTLVRLVNDANADGEKWSLTARAAGTDMGGGALGESIVVEFARHMNHIKEVGDSFAVCEPGVMMRDFETELRKRGLFLPCYPASKDICALGGMVANNCGGEKTLKYGKIDRYVMELRMVLRDGEEYAFQELSLDELADKLKLKNLEGEVYRGIYELVEKNTSLLAEAKPRVSKNSSGYFLWDVFDRQNKKFDLTRLIVGSQGTLGLITEIKLRLLRPKPHSRLLVIFLKEFAALPEIVTRVLAQGPESFESYDDHTFKIAVRLFPALVRKLRGSIFKLAFSFLPEFWMAATGGIPKLVLLAEFTGDTPREAQVAADRAAESLGEFGLRMEVTRSEAAGEKYWVIRRESFSLLRQHAHGLTAAPFIDDIVVRPERLPQFLPRLTEIIRGYDIIDTIAGHMGDGNFHIIPLMDLTKPGSREIIFELMDKVYRLVWEFGGSISGEHNDGIVRTPYVSMMFAPAVCALFEKTKRILDPDNIFNPGKKVGGTLDFAKKHLI